MKSRPQYHQPTTLPTYMVLVGILPLITSHSYLLHSNEINDTAKVGKISGSVLTWRAKDFAAERVEDMDNNNNNKTKIRGATRADRVRVVFAVSETSQLVE
jgi:hypothetical protein